MRRYSRDEEERIRAVRLVREWVRSGPLDGAQAMRLEADLRVDLRRTNPFLRVVIALFTALIVAASVTLIIDVFDIRSDLPVAGATGIAAVACIALAEYLVVSFRVYRFGVEEALAVASVVLLAVSGATLTPSPETGPRGLPQAVAALIGAAGGLGLYLRFGLVYAAVGAMVCLAFVPFQFAVTAEVQRGLAAAALAPVLAIVRSKRLRDRGEYPGGEYGWLQAAAIAGVYLVLNFQLPWGWNGSKGLFYWTTYAAIWILPGLALVSGVRDKDRELLDIGLMLALVTLTTNKPYLGRPQHTWDPILLGVVLIATSVAVRRWLASGPSGQRYGFTPKRLLEGERAIPSLVGTVSAAIAPPPVSPARAEPPEPSFRGGRSGGGGGGGHF